MNDKIIDLSSVSEIVMGGVKAIVQALQDWQYKLNDNITASVWIFLLAFFAVDVIIYALFRGYEIK